MVPDNTPTTRSMQKQSHTYLVTGAAGFIGSHLCQALLKNTGSAVVVGIDNVNNYYNKKIKLRRINELSKNSRFIFYKNSILEKKNIINIITRHKPDILVHAAAEVGVRNGEAHPSEYFSTNVVGAVNILEATAPYIRHAIVFSSSSVYGSTKHLPFRESEPLFPSTQLSTYGASKLAMEIAVQNFHRRTNVPITIVRPFSIYGPDGRPDMLPIKLLLSAYTNKEIVLYAPDKTSRDWTYIDDCVRYIRALMKKPGGFRIVNIGNGQPILLHDVITTAQKVLARRGYTLHCKPNPSNPIEMPKTWADATQLTKLCHFSAQTKFKEGFLKTADFFFSHLDLYTMAAI